jgi:hypothetical protein
MAGGKEFAVRSYNSVLTHLSGQGEIPAALFPPLPETASLDEVGIASAQLAEYLRAGLPEPEPQAGSGPKLGDGNVFFNIGGLGEIGELVREHLPEWLRGKKEQSQPQPEGQETPASDHPPPPTARNPARLHPGATGAPLPPQRARIEELRPERQPEETSR